MPTFTFSHATFINAGGGTYIYTPPSGLGLPKLYVVAETQALATAYVDELNTDYGSVQPIQEIFAMHGAKTAGVQVVLGHAGSVAGQFGFSSGNMTGNTGVARWYHTQKDADGDPIYATNMALPYGVSLVINLDNSHNGTPGTGASSYNFQQIVQVSVHELWHPFAGDHLWNKAAKVEDRFATDVNQILNDDSYKKDFIVFAQQGRKTVMDAPTVIPEAGNTIWNGLIVLEGTPEAQGLSAGHVVDDGGVMVVTQTEFSRALAGQVLAQQQLGRVQAIQALKSGDAAKATALASPNRAYYIIEGRPGGQTVKVTLSAKGAGQLGSLIGSKIGDYLSGGDSVTGIVYSSVLGAIGNQIGVALASGTKIESVMTSANATAFGQDVWNRLQSAAIGSVSSLLTMELGQALGVKGFGAELFNTIGSTLTNQAVTNIVQEGAAHIFDGFHTDQLFKGGGGATLVANAVGAFLGSKLGSMVVQPQTTAGVVLSSIGSAAGAWAMTTATLSVTSSAGVSTAGAFITAQLGLGNSWLALNLIAPGIGAFVGFVLGALIGNLFGKKKPKIPSASAETVLQIPYARYELGAVTVTNNGNRDLVTSMATTARDTLNGLIAMVAYTNTTAYVSNLNGSSTTQKYGHTGGQIYVTINGVQTNFGSADQAVEFGTLAAIRNTKIVGGDIFAKRVIARSPAADLTSLTGDLQIASDYRFYASNRALIDGFIKGAYATLTEAEQSYYASNKALIDKAQTQGTAALTSGELSTYNANKPTIDKIIGALENQVLANPWIITLERAVNELGLAKWTASDFYGGLQGFLGSFDLAGHGVAFENVRLAASGAGAVVSLRGGSALEPFAASTKAHVGFGTSAASGGWASQDLNPRFLADVNGDGRQDMVGVGNSQVIVELGQANGTFGGGLVASTNLTAAVNWTSQNISPRMAGDVNGDGRADLVGFGGDGTYVMLGQANGAFGAVFKANAGYGSTGGAGGWSSQDAYPRFLADVNGDGRTDVVGVGGSIVLVSLGQADGTFANGVVASSQFTGAAGWAGQDRDPRTAADVNGDGRADLVGFADDGVYVALGQANGTFAASYKAITAFGYAAGGWSSFNANPRYVKDMNGDGRADIVGYGNGALYVSLAQADGMFAPHQIFSTPYVADAGWGPQSIQPRMIGDVDGDGMMDLVAVGTDGVYVQRGDRASAGLFSILPSAAQGGQSVSIDSLAAIGYGAVAPGSTTSGNDLVDRSLATGGLTIDDNHTEIETTYQYYWNGWDYDVVETQTPVTRDGGDDIFVGGAGDDTLYGRAGWDWLDGGAGDDTLDGGSQNDTLLGAAGKDLLRGGDGDDYIAGGDGHEGGDGQGGGLFGGAGNDVLVGGAGMDGLWGEDGDDTFIVDEDGGATYDSFIGGAGSNTISYERFSAGVGIDLGARSPSDSSQHIWYGDYFWDVENATGTAFNDTMVGDAIGNILKGGAGADSIGGRDGGDILEGGAGADFLWGDGGYDWVQYTGSSAGVYIDLSTGEAFGGDADGDVFDSIESVSGSKLADQLKGDAGDNYLVGKEGDDWLVATTGADMLIGDEGKDFVDYSAATAGVSLNLGGYTPTGQATGSGYSGLAASQSYIGVEGVVGSAYADSLSAGDGDQTFVGGAGNDTLSGGAGTDTYVLNLGDGADTIVEDNGGWNILSLGEGIKASDLVMGTAGGTNGWLSVTVRGGNASAYVGGNFAQLTNARVKTIDFNGGGQLDIGSVDYAVGGVTDGADTLVGLGGEHYDLIIGLNGDDTIWGRASGQLESTGNVIIGGLGNDTINTSNGDDQFAYDRAGLDANGAVIANVDTITDAGGEDTLVFGSTVTAQDVIYQVVGNDLYIGAKDAANPTLTASQVADRVKIVGGGVKWVETDPYGEPMGGSFINTVEYVVAGGTSIDLRKLDIAWTVQTYVNYSNYYPVALDLDGDGLDLSTVEASSVVVKTAQGGISQIAWVGPADGLLAVDRDGDGAINRLSEISFVQDRPGATSDLEGLRTWDSNGDGLLDKADKDFGRILLFVDANQNGRSTAKELRTLEEAGIKAINLGGTATGYTAAMTTESFVQNTISFVWADGREGQGYDVALARRVLGSEGLYAGEYQAEWGARDEDGTLGQLLNDPKTAAKAARIKARKGLLDRLGASYDEVKAAAQLDFSDTDKVDASVARRWKKMDASQRAAWLSGQATGLDDQSNLAALKAVSSGQALAKALNDSARAGRDLVDRGLAQAGAVVSPGDPSRPSGGGSTTAQGLGVDFGAASGLLSGLGGGLGGGLTASQPLDGVVQADATIGQDQAWWRGQTDGGLAGAGSLAGLLAAMDQGVGDRAPGARSASDDPALTQQQRLLRQAMAGFGGQAGGSAAIWNRDAAQASAVLAAAGQPTTPLALNLALAS